MPNVPQTPQSKTEKPSALAKKYEAVSKKMRRKILGVLLQASLYADPKEMSKNKLAGRAVISDIMESEWEKAKKPTTLFGYPSIRSSLSSLASSSPPPMFKKVIYEKKFIENEQLEQSKYKRALDLILSIKSGIGIDELKKKFGLEIEFAFQVFLSKGYWNKTNLIQEKFREDSKLVKSFNKTIQNAFRNKLSEGRIDDALKIQKQFGEKIDLTEGIMAGYLTYISKGKLKRALEMEKQFSDQIKELQNNSKYQKILIDFCKRYYSQHHPGIYEYFMDNIDNIVEVLKNDFYIKNKRHIDSIVLLKFKALTLYAQQFVRQTLKNKVKEYGYDPDTPDYKTQLSDAQKLELRQLMQDKQEDVRAKIQNIASPELIRAYQNEQEEGEMEWLKVA